LSRQKLIKHLKKRNSQIDKPVLENVINIFTKGILDAILSNRAVEIRGLGRWHLKKLKENYKARNPSNNKLIYKPERVKIRFRPSKKFKKMINK
tara:strand:- start:701 stop:982 length:282 start_codon:yes stop_codon:yes gene_type:complete